MGELACHKWVFMPFLSQASYKYQGLGWSLIFWGTGTKGAITMVCFVHFHRWGCHGSQPVGGREGVWMHIVSILHPSPFLNPLSLPPPPPPPPIIIPFPSEVQRYWPQRITRQWKQNWRQRRMQNWRPPTRGSMRCRNSKSRGRGVRNRPT